MLGLRSDILKYVGLFQSNDVYKNDLNLIGNYISSFRH